MKNSGKRQSVVSVVKYGMKDVSKVLPAELYNLVVEFMGCVRFWRHCFIACCVNIEERPWLDETFRHYEVRTGISSCSQPQSGLIETDELADLNLDRCPMISKLGTRSQYHLYGTRTVFFRI